jgi:hypothetical protein
LAGGRRGRGRRQAEQLSFEIADVLARVKERGDLFAPVLTRRQDLGGRASADVRLTG